MSAQSMTNAAKRVFSPTNKEQRRGKRIEFELTGRFLDHDENEFDLKTANVSCTGAYILCEHSPEVGTDIICYFNDLGRISSRVIRHLPNGFAVNFNLTMFKRDKIADKLTWLINKDALGLEEQRDLPRFAMNGPALVERENGRHIQCRVIDFSLASASFETSASLPPIGEVVKAGILSGRVIRSEGKIFAIRYLNA